MAVSCNKCAAATSGGFGCGGECVWDEKRRTCIHVKDEVLAPVDCGNDITAPTCRQCRSDYHDNFNCRGDCIPRPERPDALQCTWEGREFVDDRDNSLRRDIFAKELVAALNKFRKNNNRAELRRDENDNHLNRIAYAYAEAAAQKCNMESKQLFHNGRNNQKNTGLQLATCDKFPAGTDLVFGDAYGKHPWKQFENTMLRSFVARLVGVGVSKKKRCPGACNGDTVTFVVAMFY